MKLAIREHSQSTKISDLLMVLFAVAYFLSGLCFAQDLFACAIFSITAICIIIIKYLKLNQDEEQ